MAFNEADTAHGLVKRRLVKGYCGGLFARELESTKFKSVPSGHYCVQYVDAFSWRGEYGGPNTRNSQSLTDEQDDDIEKMGSPIIALDRGLDRCKVMTKRSLSFPSQILLAIHFIFNDISSENVSHLKTLVVEVLKSYNWEEEKDNVDGYEKMNKNSESFLWRYSTVKSEGKLWIIRTTFVVGKFEQLMLPEKANKTFSLIDPCGIKQIPFDAVKRFLGRGKEVFINLMVWTIRRSSQNPMHAGVIQKLFGDPEANIIVSSFTNCEKESCTERPLCCTKQAYKNYVGYYSQTIGKEYNAEAVHFLFSKGKKNKMVGDQFYMVYLSSDMDLKQVKMMKDSMMSNVQTEDGELRHTDFYSFNGIHIPFGRKTTNEEESKVIHKMLQKQSLTLFDVKYHILVHTPFTFHSRALGLLEKTGLLTVDSNDEKRKRGNFKCTNFSKWFENENWKLEFHEDLNTQEEKQKKGVSKSRSKNKQASPRNYGIDLCKSKELCINSNKNTILESESPLDPSTIEWKFKEAASLGKSSYGQPITQGISPTPQTYTFGRDPNKTLNNIGL